MLAKTVARISAPSSIGSSRLSKRSMVSEVTSTSVPSAMRM